MVKKFTSSDKTSIKKLLSKRKTSNEEIEKKVREILFRVREEGDPFIEEMTKKFDCPSFRVSEVRIPSQGIASSLSKIPKEDLEILKEAISNISDFHKRQKRESWIVSKDNGIMMGQLISPVERVGLYVPGGTGGNTPLISTLIMNAIPAKIAGVKRLIVTTPPTSHGEINPYLLATAYLLGIDEIYTVGSAWAIGALAFGTKYIPKVDMIVGPGNIYVTIAKKLLIGEVGIDMIAGPSEIAIIADKSANPKWLAADLLSQAEHDVLACSMLISPEDDILRRTEEEILSQLEGLPRKKIAKESLEKWGIFIKSKNLKDAFELINIIAPEHLELHLKDPMSWIGQVKNAGCVFIGEYTPEALGDYFAGPNHVLPTTSTARFSSGLSVDTFYKKTNFLWAQPQYAKETSFKVARMARLEGLEAHARSAEQRGK